MRLKHIKLVGFKSFVDPTKVPFPDQMTCVVGPNGCGKSNVIDAVRWVLGESSAKNLRGDAMTDVIFNGSSSRKPVSQASVELVFDNSSGRIQGEYASYQEISVKRQVTRDGQSNYFLNSSKCRRRDITDLFLGTGLGPRSYAIIEQGMISRLIESKPQELRIFIEEAAGISKYKERRRETENRIGHTRENLERITDVRDELGQQLEKLQRQAAAARRFKDLKAQERQLKGQLYALRWLKQEHRREALTQERNEHETELARWQAEQTGDERGTLERQQQADELKHRVDEQQQHVFTLSNRVTRLEQSIQHHQQLRQQRQQRQQQLQDELVQLQQQAQEDGADVEQVKQRLEELEPQQEVLAEQYEELDERWQQADERWRQFQRQQREQQQRQQQLQQQAQQIQLQRQRAQQGIEHAQQQYQQLQQQLAELSGNDYQQQVDQLDEELQQQQQRQHELTTALEQQQEQLTDRQHAVEQHEHQRRQQQLSLQQHQARLSALQQIVKDEQHELSAEQQHWLTTHHAKPMVEVLQVEPEWQYAVEQWIAPWLNSYWVTDKPALEALPHALSVCWPDHDTPADVGIATVADVVNQEASAWPLLSHCALLNDATEAEQVFAQHKHAWFALTKNGDWFTRGAVNRAGAQTNDSVLAMRQEITELQQQSEQHEAALATAEAEWKQAQQGLQQQQQNVAELQQQLANQNTKVSTCEQSHHYALERWQQQQQTHAKYQQQQQQLTQQIEESEAQLEQLQEQYWQLEEQQQAVPEDASEQAMQLEQAARELQQQLQQTSSQQQQQQLEQQHLTQQLQQHEKLNSRHQQRRQSLQEELEQLALMAAEADDQESQREQLQELLEQREEASEQLTQLRDQLADVEQQIHELSKGSSALRSKIEQVQQRIQNTDIELAKLQERTQSILAALADTQMSLKELLPQLTGDEDEKQHERQLEKVQNQIKRLGAINLAAIEEAETQKERKDYLDQQYDDLSSALDTLEEAMRKIDRETRQRFKTTFDAINQDLQLLFPKVFGGGSASLELTDDDLLETGVAIMARPPGKKNSTIHLLSGGEKALTALSLVFAIFRLNPAPFCLLDEVDAPLDDANVGRFCRLVSEMSESVQFIYISHNKVAMEMASHLAGVTMQEAGVSRLVAVDVEQAVAMTEGE